jgi:endonuclease/exonuclease/phosphatase family metal-dependent hydrolase
MPLLPPESLGFGPPPSTSLKVIDDLARGLDERVPKKKQGNLLIGTWNIAQFARVTKRWRSAAGDSPKRNLQDICCIAEVISRFDVCALVEVKRNLEALRLLMQILGPDWGFVVSDTTEGQFGHHERLGFVCHLRRVRPSGLAGELVVPDAELDADYAELKQQFWRTPYTVSFRARDKTFTLVSVHILYGGKSTDREPELRRFAKWMHDHADDPDQFNRNMIALGDFNIDRYEDPNWNAFVVEYGLSPPDKLLDVPRTVGETPHKHSYYDQIAWFNKGKRSALTLTYRDAGGFIWTDYILEQVGTTAKQARISDHFPLWTEFSLADA